MLGACWSVAVGALGFGCCLCCVAYSFNCYYLANNAGNVARVAEVVF